MPKVLKDENNENLPDELQKALLAIVQKVELEDSWVRKQQIKEWKKHERFWHGLQYIYWSESSQDWLSPVNSRFDPNFQEEGREDAEGPFYDYVINIYKAYGESIIAALGAQTPAVRFPPDDADNDDDVVTAKTYSKISDLIGRHNKAKIVLLQSLLCLWNQGNVAAYTYSKADKAYGNLKIPVYGEVPTCPGCGYQAQGDETSCPTCSAPSGEGGSTQQPLEPQTAITGYADSPKSRVCVEIYGPLFVKYSHTAREQKDFGYLICSVDQPKAYLQDLFEHIADKIDAAVNESDQYEKVGRAPSAFSFTINDNSTLATLRRCWLRPWQFNILGTSRQDEIDALKKKFPDGCYVCFVGDNYAEARAECMDEYWTIGKAGLSQYIHSDALGQPLVPLQEMRNVAANLTLETIEQGISSVFADPEVLNFKDFSKHELRPGMYIPAKKRIGEKLADAFFEGPRAQLGKETPEFVASIDHDAQFVSGGFPSIYGGQVEGSSRTAAEYDMSRQMALQRLSLCLHFLNDFWATWNTKAVKLFLKAVTEDERYTVRDGDNYINVWIRQAELKGKVGEVEPETSDSFPVTIAQKQSILMKLIGMNNEILNAAIFDVENRKLVADALAFPDFKIPQENQRLKQSREIQDAIAGTPIMVDPELDDSATHVEVLRDYLVGPIGLDLKLRNPEVYGILREHLVEHLQAMAPPPVAQPGVTAPPSPINVLGMPGQPPVQQGAPNGAS